MSKLMKPVFDGFICSGIKVVNCTDGAFHHFGLSFSPSIELVAPISKKVLPNVLLYFSNICDIHTTAYDTSNKIDMTNFSFYDYRLHNDDNILIRLSMPTIVIDSIRSKAMFEKCRREFIDIVCLRLVLFQQKMENTTQ